MTSCYYRGSLYQPLSIMGKHYLNTLFAPKSVAVFGASDRPDSVGQIVFKNMLESGFKGTLYPINSKNPEVQGQRAYAGIGDIGEPVELVVIATPPQTVPGIIESCGIHGVKAAVIITAGFGEAGAEGAALERQLLETARRYNIRLIGPNCLGIMRPSIGLNATSTRATRTSATSLSSRSPARYAPPFWIGRSATMSASPAWCRWARRPTWISARSSTTSCPMPTLTAS
jgi:predicted CoA-binding protein